MSDVAPQIDGVLPRKSAQKRGGFRRPRVLAYAERPADPSDTKIDRWGQRQIGRFKALGAWPRAWKLRSILPAVRRHEAAFAAMDDATLQKAAWALRTELAQQTDLAALSVRDAGRAFALIREAGARTLGMRHYDVQMLAAWAMLRGMAAEMRTGEGKTLSATLAAATAALMGLPVHVITVNDYLAARDVEEMEPLYHFLGLTTGKVVAGQSRPERAEIYRADIVYACNKELAFDYLRDRMELRHRPGNLPHKVDTLLKSGSGTRVLRGLHFAIVDEGDSVLIDEARTPLIISGEVKAERGIGTELFVEAMAAADKLTEGRHYKVIADQQRIDLHDAGIVLLEEMASEDEGAFGVAAIREHAVVQALSARHLFHRDIHYILRDGKVQIVDEYTGRVMEDRSWSEGLHQMVELKEGVEMTPTRKTMGRITYQRFFRRYRYLSAMSGTARDAAVEFWAVYRLAVVCIPTHRPDIRSRSRDRVFLREAAKWQAIGARVEELHRKGAPVLLGTRSVAASDAASAKLTELGIPHQVLSARQDADEAAIVARAGQRGQVTVATNMAGRGTDIKLGADVGELGGLHVILTERHDSRRIDRQLEGRCGRQGDPGRVEAFLSLEDELMRGKGARFHRRLAAVLKIFGPRAAGFPIRMRQRAIERLHARMRHDLLEADRNLGDMLGFSGQME